MASKARTRAEPPKGVSEAVEGFLAGRSLDGRDAVLAAVARALAPKIDNACESSSSRDSSALPPMVRRLLDATDGVAQVA
jgi:hypothetical protein